MEKYTMGRPGLFSSHRVEPLDCFLVQHRLFFAPAPPVYGGAACPIPLADQELNSSDGSPFPDAGLIVYFFIRGNLLKRKRHNEEAFPLTGIAAPPDSPQWTKIKEQGL
jgi:hypothetical protein